MKKNFIVIIMLLALILIGCDFNSTRTVTFDSDGGTEVEKQIVSYNGFAKEPTVPTKNGYDFEGWFLDDELFNFSQTEITEDITITAKWKEQSSLDDVFEVKFVDWDNTVLKEEEVEKGQSATPPTSPVRVGYKFIGWDKEFDNVTSDLTVTAKYEKEGVVTKYEVKFVDWDNTVLKEEEVETGQSATPPTSPARVGYKFIGWDKEFDNVTSDLTVTAKYEKVDDTTEYTITYELNGGVWGYENKNAYVDSFLTDFYNFVSPQIDMKTFKHGTGLQTGFKGSWSTYIGGSVGNQNYLLYDNNIDADNDAYFLNSTLYKAKWYNLSEWVKSQNNRFGGTGGYQYGALDFYRYIVNDPEGYINVYGDKFYGYPEVNEVTLKTYTYSSSDITLPTPLSSKFLGWYSSSDLTGAPVTTIPAKTTGNIVLYASWDNSVTYELSFISGTDVVYETRTVRYGDEIVLPTPTKSSAEFLGWYYNGIKVDSPMKYNFEDSITLTAVWKNTQTQLQDLEYSGEKVVYRNSTTVVQIPTDYVQPDKQFRAAWVSSLVSDFAPSANQTTMKANLTSVLDTLESYNMNAIIFHVRTHNNAFYKTNLAPMDSRYGTYTSFDTWDYLDWFITECHNRGIEFHAWLNPYRITTGAASAEAVAAQYASYPLNPASKAENILVSTSGSAILNPAKQEVRDYIVDVCMELIENYDIDAIHFDDYFYISLGGSSIINEPDQSDYVDYIAKNPSCGYSSTSVNNKGQWRRDNVDTFIHDLSTSIRDYNAKNNKKVQLGISPTGIYRNGNGVVTYDSNGTAITNGSNTAGQEHYNSYLFCDSKKWVDNEWIDYILPQSYWSFGQNVASYAAVMDWWSSVVRYKDVNLYSGIGLYMSISGGYTWTKEAYEVSNQILYSTKHSEIKGVCFFSYKSITTVQSSASNIAYQGLMRVKNEFWTTKVSTPDTMASLALKN